MSKRVRPADFAELTSFAAVARTRSFRHAARDLGLAPSTLSHRVRALEARLGTRLLHRTTRAVAPTEAGTRFLKELGPLLDGLDHALASAGLSAGEPVGKVRLAAPRLAIRTLVGPMLARMAEAYPGVILDVRTIEHDGNFVGQGYDLAIQPGGEISHDMVAVALGAPFVTAIVGAPAYFQERGRPQHPKDLAEHACIGCLSGPGSSLYRWLFRKDEQEIVVAVSGPLITDDPDLMLAAALGGIGVWHGIDQLALPYLRTGLLDRVLADWSPSIPGFFLCYAGGEPLAPATRAVVDVLKNVART